MIFKYSRYSIFEAFLNENQIECVFTLFYAQKLYDPGEVRGNGRKRCKSDWNKRGWMRKFNSLCKQILYLAMCEHAAVYADPKAGLSEFLPRWQFYYAMRVMQLFSLVLWTLWRCRFQISSGDLFNRTKGTQGQIAVRLTSGKIVEFIYIWFWFLFGFSIKKSPLLASLFAVSILHAIAVIDFQDRAPITACGKAVFIEGELRLDLSVIS